MASFRGMHIDWEDPAFSSSEFQDSMTAESPWGNSALNEFTDLMSDSNVRTPSKSEPDLAGAAAGPQHRTKEPGVRLYGSASDNHAVEYTGGTAGGSFHLSRFDPTTSSRLERRKRQRTSQSYINPLGREYEAKLATRFEELRQVITPIAHALKPTLGKEEHQLRPVKKPRQTEILDAATLRIKSLTEGKAELHSILEHVHSVLKDMSTRSQIATGTANQQHPIVDRTEEVVQKCDRCRAKKTRCDGRRPTCNACARVSAECKVTEFLGVPKLYIDALTEKARILDDGIHRIEPSLRKLAQTRMSAPFSNDAKQMQEHSPQTREATVKPLSDKVTRVLGIGWRIVYSSEVLQITQSAYTKIIQDEEPRVLKDVVVLAANTAIPEYLLAAMGVSSGRSFYLFFSDDFLSTRLVTTETAQLASRLQMLPALVQSGSMRAGLDPITAACEEVGPRTSSQLASLGETDPETDGENSSDRHSESIDHMVMQVTDQAINNPINQAKVEREEDHSGQEVEDPTRHSVSRRRPEDDDPDEALQADSKSPPNGYATSAPSDVLFNFELCRSPSGLVVVFDCNLLEVRRALASTFLRLLRARIEPRRQRLEWVCSCGKTMHGDYALHESIADSSLFRTLPRGRIVPNSSARSSLPRVPSKAWLSSFVSRAGPHEVPSSRSTGGPEANPGPTDIQAKADTSQCPAGTNLTRPTQDIEAGKATTQTLDTNAAADAFPRSVPAFFELCVNCSETQTSLGEVWLTDGGGHQRVKTDLELFAQIRERYDALRRKGLHSILYRPHDIHFVRFGVQKGGTQIGIYETPLAIPPETEFKQNRYHYHECPLDPLPPIDSRTFFHYFWEHASHPRSSGSPAFDTLFYNRLPKKLGTSMLLQPDPGKFHLGWGVHIIEGPNKPLLAWLATVILVLSFVASLSYDLVRKGEIESGFTIGSWLVGVLATTLGAVYFHLADMA